MAGLLRLPQYSDRFKEVLKDRAPQFISSLIQVGRTLGADCDSKSIIASAMTAAALDLPINASLGFAWLVPYKKKGQKYAQFQLGARGYLQLALRTGQYSKLNVCELYEGELLDYDRLTGELVIDETRRKSDTVIGYASYLKLVSGFEHSEYWTVDEVKDHAKRYSQAYKSDYDTPWKSHFDEMAKKTVLSMHIRKWGPMSIQVAQAHQADQAVFKDVDSEPEYVDNSDVTVDEKPDLMPTIPEVMAEVDKAGLYDDNQGSLSSQAALEDVLDASEIPHDLFINYVNVNGIDKKLGFDASSLSTIAEWPDSACKKIGEDTELMARVTKRFGGKKK